METCPTCGTAYGKRRRCYRCEPGYRRPSYGRKPTGEWRSCEVCQQAFYRPASRLQHEAGRFCSKRCKHASMQGQLFPNPAHAPTPLGHRRVRLDGYVEVKVKTGAHAYALEHRVVAEEKYGRPLLRGEHVHHINGVKSDNRPENLEIVAAGAHARLSNAQAVIQRRALRQELAALQGLVERYERLYGKLPPMLDVAKPVVICEHCGQSYQPTKPAHARRSRYCSQQCKLDAMHAKAKEFHASRRPAPITCQHVGCQKVFQVPWNRLAQAKYCSRACQSAAQRLPIADKTCEVCGVSYRPRPDGAAKSRFCSIACRRIGRAQDWRGPLNPRRRLSYDTSA